MERDDSTKMSHVDLLRMTTKIVASYVSNNDVSGSQIPEVIRSTYITLIAQKIGGGEAIQEQKKPAVTIRRSVTPEFIISL